MVCLEVKFRAGLQKELHRGSGAVAEPIQLWDPGEMGVTWGVTSWAAHLGEEQQQPPWGILGPMQIWGGPCLYWSLCWVQGEFLLTSSSKQKGERLGSWCLPVTLCLLEPYFFHLGSTKSSLVPHWHRHSFPPRSVLSLYGVIPTALLHCWVSVEPFLLLGKIAAAWDAVCGWWTQLFVTSKQFYCPSTQSGSTSGRDVTLLS